MAGLGWDSFCDEVSQKNFALAAFVCPNFDEGFNRVIAREHFTVAFAGAERAALRFSFPTTCGLANVLNSQLHNFLSFLSEASLPSMVTSYFV